MRISAKAAAEAYHIALLHGLPDGLAGYLALGLCDPAATKKVLGMGLEHVEIRAVLNDRPVKSPEGTAKAFADAAEIHAICKVLGSQHLPEYVRDPVAAVTSRRSVAGVWRGLVDARAAHSEVTRRRADGRRELSGFNAQAAEYWANQKAKQ